MLDASPQTGAGRGQATPAPPAPPPVPPDQQELHSLVGRRSELVAQLEALTERREEVADQLHGAEAAARPGLVARLGALDERIVRLEQEILQADDAISGAISAGVIAPPSLEQTETQEAPSQWDISTFEERAGMLMVGEAVIFILLGIVLYKLGWARAKARFSGTHPNDPRIDQLQNSVDAIAVEVERISEGQRYLSKRLNEAAPDVVAAGGQEDAIPVRRRAT